MAGIIFKWRYLKAGASGRHSENLIRYIAQREGVENSMTRGSTAL